MNLPKRLTACCFAPWSQPHAVRLVLLLACSLVGTIFTRSPRADGDLHNVQKSAKKKLNKSASLLSRSKSLSLMRGAAKAAEERRIILSSSVNTFFVVLLIMLAIKSPGVVENSGGLFFTQLHFKVREQAKN